MKHKSFFSGTAYLSIPGNERFKNLIVAGFDLYGTNFGASRNNKFTPDIFETAEAEAAQRYRAEDSIIVSSGYLAAQLVIQTYMANCTLIYAPDTHPALWIGKPNPPKTQFLDWVEKTIREINDADRPVMLIANSLNNIIPEIYDFDWLNKIKEGKAVTLLIDDSHGLGILGPDGEGVYSRIPKLPNVELIVVASMAKGLGIDAGVILSRKYIIEKLRESPVYAGASPPSPGFLYAYVNARNIYKEELEKLRVNMSFFNGFIEDHVGIIYCYDLPVYLIENDGARDYLALNEITISSFAYPDPKGEALNRVVLNSGHTKEEIRKLASVLTSL
jgi:8-amino-7-oxononanoate synthase